MMDFDKTITISKLEFYEKSADVTRELLAMEEEPGEATVARMLMYAMYTADLARALFHEEDEDDREKTDNG